MVSLETFGECYLGVNFGWEVWRNLVCKHEKFFEAFDRIKKWEEEKEGEQKNWV